jgi:hypothetical protein
VNNHEIMLLLDKSQNSHKASILLLENDLKTILEYSFSLSNTLLSSRVAAIEIYFVNLKSDRSSL